MIVNMELLAEHSPRVFSDLEEFLRDNPAQGETTDHVELFTRYLTWNGIVGYSSQIRDALYALITCSQEHLTSTDQADTQRLALLLGVKP